MEAGEQTLFLNLIVVLCVAHRNRYYHILPGGFLISHI